MSREAVPTPSVAEQVPPAPERHDHLPGSGGRRLQDRDARSASAPRLRRVADGLRVGVQLPEIERDIRWPEYASMARAAEEVGFDSIWLGDHYLYREEGWERGPWEAWTFLAGLAAVTERVRLGPLVACLNFHNPAVLAKKAAAVDELSGGRLTLGVGAGWNRTEFDAFGIPFDHRASRFEESFEIVRRLLDGERVTSEGRFHQVRDAVLLPRPARHTPLMVGSSGERVLAATLPHVDIWNTWYDWYGNTPDGLRAKLREIDAACERAGRDPSSVERSACVLVRLADTKERPDVEGVTPLEGSPGEIGAGLRAMAEAGADEAILVLDPINETSIHALGHVVRDVVG
jgi:probable F420-dependent oxidoreductase